MTLYPRSVPAFPRLRSPQRDVSFVRRGFTLLEVMLAVTIFSLLATMIFTTFRTGIQAYERANRQTDLMGRARFVFDTLERDIHNLYFLDESNYNVTMRSKVNELNQALWQAELNDDWDSFYQRYGDPNDPDARQKAEEAGTAFLGNPFEAGIMMDLQWVAESNDGQSMLTFAQYRPVRPDRPVTEWGLSRVRYRAGDGVLVRQVEEVFDPPRDVFGEAYESPKSLEQDILAEGLQEFHLTYGYWFDETWIESSRWNSNRRELRNSFNTLTLIEEELQQSIEEDPNLSTLIQARLNQSPADNLPAYVRVRLTLADPQNQNFTQSFQTLIRVPGSMETMIPNSQLEDDERRDEEIELRLQNERGGYYLQ